MVTLDQVKLLENKVAKTIEYVGQVIGENTALRQKEADLQAKLEAHQKRIDELESLIAHFKEDQSRIEGGILSALERLNRFEDAIEKNLNEKPAAKAGGTGLLSASQPASAPQAPAAAPVKAPAKKAAPKVQPSSAPQPASSSLKRADTREEGVFFEIAEMEAPENDAVDSLEGELLNGENTVPPEDRELDIF